MGYDEDCLETSYLIIAFLHFYLITSKLSLDGHWLVYDWLIDPTPFRLWCNGSPALWGEGTPMQDTDRVRQLCAHVQEEGGRKPWGLGWTDTVSAGNGERNDLLPQDELFHESCTHGRRGRHQSNCWHGGYKHVLQWSLCLKWSLPYRVGVDTIKVAFCLFMTSWWHHGDIIVNGLWWK